MDHILGQIAVLAGGILAGNVLTKIVFSAAHKMKAAFHRNGSSNDYSPSPYYGYADGAYYNYYQTSGYYHS
ncbi:hypothetical protein I4U23_004648 [Adineta vaga]|nr:hypothetical protein I4U23_004648 [Adineta vaga]